MKPTVRRIAGVIAIAALPLSLLATTSSASTGSSVSVVGYSIVANAYTALEQAFNATPAGQGVTFTNSFGASTTQALDVEAGQPADVVNFSAQPDLNLLINAGLVPRNWDSSKAVKAQQGIVTDSEVAIVVRPGNPLGITGWNSLTTSGVKIVTPDPLSSGSARWNLLGAYESQLLQGKNASHAYNFLNKLIGNVVSEPTSGGKALSAFIAGTGNVLLAYESDALAAVKAGEPVQIIHPQQNILIQNPAALTNVGTTNPAAQAFYKFIFSKAGQQIWLAQGYRPTLASLHKQVMKDFFTAKKLTAISQLGGWKVVNSDFFSPSGYVTVAENNHGFTS